MVSYLSAAQRLILKVMAEVKAELRDLKKMVHQLQGQGNPVSNEEEVGLPEGLLLPVGDIVSLNRLEDELKRNKAFRNQLVCIKSVILYNMLSIGRIKWLCRGLLSKKILHPPPYCFNPSS